jgi:hypothetical protein
MAKIYLLTECMLERTEFIDRQIDQLLGYVSWRATKIAALFSTTKRNFQVIENEHGNSQTAQNFTRQMEFSINLVFGLSFTRTTTQS